MEVARTSLVHAGAPTFSVAVCGPVRCASAQPLAPCLRSGDLAHTAVDGGVLPPRSHRVFPSQDVTFDESVPFYRLFPYRTAPLPPPPLFLAPDPVEPAEVAVDSRPAGGAEPERAEPERAEPERAEPGGVESGGADPGVLSLGAGFGGTEPGVAESRGTAPGVAEPGGAEPGGVAVDCEAPGGPPSSQQLRECVLTVLQPPAG
ncbi:unnamed protein product [Closterium sp. NIES-64]|nr:unnamed protein product [Closterium sp. NIES-64]